MPVEQAVSVSSTTIIAIVISVVGFIITGLLATVGGICIWLINRWVGNSDKKDAEQKLERIEIARQVTEDRKEILTQMKTDRDALSKKVEGDKTAFDERVIKISETFGAQLKSIGTEFMMEIKEVKQSMVLMSQSITELSNTFKNSEKESSARYQATEKRLDEQLDEIGRLRTARHDSDNHLTRLMLQVETNSRNYDAKVKTDEAIRGDGFRRLDLLEMAVFKEKAISSKKN